jgi:integrase
MASIDPTKFTWVTGADGVQRKRATKDSEWRARWRTPAGESRSQTFPRKVDAEKHLTAMEHSKHSGSYIDPSAGKVTLGSWWAAWTSTRVDLRPSTQARDESYAKNHLIPQLGDLPLGKLDRTRLRSWVAEMTADGLAPATVNKAVQLLSRALTAAVEERLIPSNPALGLPLPRIEREEMRFLVPADVGVLADTIDARYRAFVLLGAYGGLRLGELAGLRRSRVDLLKRRVDVAEILVEVRGHHHFGPPKTRAGRRSVPIPKAVTEALTEHLAGLGGGDLVFPAPEGGPMRPSQFRRRAWQPACVRAGVGAMVEGEDKKRHYVGLRIHDLRHTAVALWIAAGASPKEVAARAGHTSVVTVLDRYGHLLPGSEEAVTDALDAMFEAAKTPPTGKLIELKESRPG